ncbi:MAG: hypothetical protein SFY32_07795 [Bacteroidota bacterium]|nr:hypothetical protein [Bacteroidota bacterium]
MNNWTPVLFLSLSIAFAQNSSVDSVQTNNEFKLGFTEISAGVDIRINMLRTPSDPSNAKFSGFYGGFSRVQSSFLGVIFADKLFKKIILADYEVGELIGGFNNSNIPGTKTGFLPLYNFELGFLIMYKLSPKTDLWFSSTLLQFSRDYFSDFFGGSNYKIRIRNHRFIYEATWISENKLYFGAFNFISVGSNIPKIQIGTKYFVAPRKIVGFNLVSLPAFTEYHSEFGWERVMTLQLLYGLNF